MAKGSVKKKVSAFVIGAPLFVLGGGGGVVGYQATQYEPRLKPGTVVAGQDLSGKTADEASETLKAWWESQRDQTITFQASRLRKVPAPMTLAALGAEFDTEATFAPLKYDAFFESLARTWNQEKPEVTEFTPVIRFTGKGYEGLKAFVEANRPPNGPARARWRGGQVVTTPEIAGIALDEETLTQRISEAALGNRTVSIPFKEAPKRVPDSELAKIRAVYSEFSTRFNAGQRARSANIRLAATSIDGTVLMPGESFDFNAFLGPRTRAKGYQEAGVFVNGRHDTGVGGGICQVSTTIYNAALIGDMKIVSRSPHSLPVPYVPLGRDAAVSYGGPNLVFQNTTDHPVGLSATYEPGRLTFRILGPAPVGRRVTFETRVMRTWSNGEKLEHDPSLAYGVRRVVDKGGAGRQVQTTMIVTENGVTRRISLGTSTYRGGPRIIAVNKTAKPPVAAPPASDIPPSPAGETEEFAP